MMEEGIIPTREFLGTVYVVDNGKVLLTFNKKIQNYVPVGGHTDDNELPCACAIREAKEESGYDIELIDGNDFQSHSIPQNFAIGLDEIELDHHHINLAYVGKIVAGEELVESDEGTELRWFTKEELEEIEDLVENVKEGALKALAIFEKHINKIRAVA